MGYDTTVTPSVGDATKRSDYTRLRDSIKSVRQQEWELGGSLAAYIEDAADTWVDLPDGWQKTIDGTDTPSLGVYLEVYGRAEDGTVVTITFRLYNVTTAAAIASSEVTLVSPGATATRNESSTLTLTTGANVYKGQIKRSNINVRVSGKARVYTR